MNKSCEEMERSPVYPLADIEFIVKYLVLISHSERLRVGSQTIIYSNNPEKFLSTLKNRIEVETEIDISSFQTIMEISVNLDREPDFAIYELKDGIFTETTFSPNYVVEDHSLDELGRAVENATVVNSKRLIFVLNFDLLPYNYQRRLMSDGEAPSQFLPFRDWGFIRTENDTMCFIVEATGGDSHKKLSTSVTNRCSHYLFCVSEENS